MGKPADRAEQQSGSESRIVPANVLEELPQGKYRLVLDGGQRVLAHPAGKERNFVRLLPGDRVEVALSPNDLTRGRIVKKLDR